MSKRTNLVGLKHVTEICWWFIGEETDHLAVAIDCHGKFGEIVRDTFTFPVEDKAEAGNVVETLAAFLGVKAHYDPDSTECFQND